MSVVNIPKNLAVFLAECLDRFHDDGVDLRVHCKYHGAVEVGQLAGAVSGKGYRRVMVQRKLYLVHRVLWLMRTGEWPEEELDHIDCDKTNNRQENLRKANQFQNQRNRGPNKDRCYKGVHFKKGLKTPKWEARIEARGVSYYLGLFVTPGEAALAYDEKAREVHKEFARFNFPGLE